ncbi:MAG: hypothetical protein HY543_02905 [Deltaproteobacteria bacterium]|nr:hypothetical protein [Deltaproteobacteria bacterium]
MSTGGEQADCPCGGFTNGGAISLPTEPATKTGKVLEQKAAPATQQKAQQKGMTPGAKGSKPSP